MSASLAEPAVIADMKNQDVHECIRKAFERIGATSLIKNAERVYVHVPLAASLFRRGRPVQGTYLDAELAEAIALNCLHRQVTFYEAPAAAHRNVRKLFEKLGYLKLAEKHSHIQLMDLRTYENANPQDIIRLDCRFEYPPLILPAFLFDRRNLIISVGNPKAPFSEKVPGFKGLPLSLSGKALVMGSTLFGKKKLLHIAFGDIELGLKHYVVDVLERIHLAAVPCTGINGGRYAGSLRGQLELCPVEWNSLVVSSNILVADAVTAEMMGYAPFSVEYFLEMLRRQLIPSNMSQIPVIEIGESRARIREMLGKENPFLAKGRLITARDWIFGLLGEVSFWERPRLLGGIIPSIVRYRMGKRKQKPA
jgi:uncharacterized protein (DUF362 family)